MPIPEYSIFRTFVVHCTCHWPNDAFTTKHGRCERDTDTFPTLKTPIFVVSKYTAALLAAQGLHSINIIRIASVSSASAQREREREPEHLV